MDEESGPGIRAYLSALYRGKWVILAAALIGGAAWYGYSTFFAVAPEYAAQGRIWIQSSGSGDQGPIVTDELFQQSSWLDLLETYAVLDPVVLDQKLYVRARNPADAELLDNLELDGPARAGTYRLVAPTDAGWVLIRDNETVTRGVTPGSVLGAGMGFIWSPPAEAFAEGREVTFELMTLRDAARSLRDQLIPEIDQRGSFLSVEFQGPDPERAASVVNALMEQFVAVAADLKSGNLDAEAEVLREQLQSTEAELAALDQRLEAHQIQSATLPSDRPYAVQGGTERTRDPAFNEYFDLGAAADAARRDRDRIASILSALPNEGLQVEALAFIPAAQSSPQLGTALDQLIEARAEREALSNRYTSEHPALQDVDARIARLEGTVIPGVLTELEAELQIQEQQLAARREASVQSLTGIPVRAMQEAQLARDRDIAADLYGDLRARYQAAELARRSSLPDVSVLDRAVPPNDPVEGPAVSIGLLIFLGAIGLALAGVILYDRLDSRIRTPDQVMSTFGLPVLGAIPRIQGARGGRNGNGEIRNLGQIREAFRQLRTSLEYAYGSAGPLVLTVSSSSMEEGKTLVSTNLGVSFAELGLRTVILDADTRRGDVHHFLGGNRTPGLTDFLQSSVKGEEVIQSTSHAGLDFIGSGTRVSHSPELLASRRMGELLAALRKMYDVILVDSPPLGAGADPLVLGSITGHMLFVVRSGSTEKDFAIAKLEPLDRLPIRVMGVVLNDYVPDKISAYRYYGSYLPGYEASTEGESGPSEDRIIAGVGAPQG